MRSRNLSISCVAALRGAFLILLVAARLAPAAQGEEADARETPPRQPLVEGRQVFEAKGCVRCHTIRDGGSIGPDLARSGSWSDVMQFAGSLWNHTPAMAAKMREQGMEHPTVSPDEMKKLAGYLFAVRFFEEPGNVARGRELFEQRSCAQCHQLGGHGGTVGPRLDELKDSASAAFMAQALWNHGPEMAAKMAEQKVERPRLEGNEVADIVAYIRGDAGDGGARELLYAQAGSPLAGKTIFSAKGCSQCHAIAGTGGAVGPDLGVQRPRSNVAEMAAALWNHGPPMWAKMKERGLPVPKLSDAEMADLLAYLYFVQYMGQAGNATRGGELLRQKACTECHGVGSRGPKGADLAASEALRSPVYWAAAMWNHTADLEQKEHVRARFDDDEMRDVVAFLRSAGARK
ncbi:MAG TPA: c-type cytochrome [Candidatus Margulisiibacteriota bacterium]|nr:c-type cytochrome [Candidatus Margulisiibacteriota bacterium]